MNLIEAMQMARAENYLDGFADGVDAAVAVLKDQMGDRSAGEDMRKIYDGVLWAAMEKVKALAAKETLGSPVAKHPGNEEAVVPALSSAKAVPSNAGPTMADAICEHCGAVEPDWNAARAFDEQANLAGKAVPGEERRAALEEAAKLAESSRTGSQIGPLYDAGFYAATSFVAERIRALLSQRPAPETAPTEEQIARALCCGKKCNASGKPGDACVAMRIRLDTRGAIMALLSQRPGQEAVGK